MKSGTGCFIINLFAGLSRQIQCRLHIYMTFDSRTQMG